jgi:3-oxoacyl-[acyl-carrier-protein] synthase II
MTQDDREAWITGVGIVSTLGDGCEATWQGLLAGRPNVDCASFSPHIVHPLPAIDFGKQIPKSDLRMMDAWQRIGTYAAGLALDSAAIKGNSSVLSHTDLIVVAGGGERDTALDSKLLSEGRTAPYRARLLNEKLMSDLRPTLFLSQLSNMLAGNISIVHGVTGSSRTFLGEEAGIEALRIARARIIAGQSDVVLVGGAHSGERKDLLLFCEAGGLALKDEFAPVFEREARGGGIALGSFGAFIVVESRAHAMARGAEPFARLASVVCNRTKREPGEVSRSLHRLWDEVEPRATGGRCAVLSGASGAEPVTSEEKSFLADLPEMPMRATGSYVGYGFDVQFSLNVALAALASSRGTLFPPVGDGGAERASDDPIDRVLVTGTGHWRGEGLALIEKIHQA